MNVNSQVQANDQVVMVNTIRHCIFDNTVQNVNHTLIMGQIIKGLKVSKTNEYDVEMASLAEALSNLIPRMTKTVMEIIIEYRVANPEAIQVMGKKNATPFNGHYTPSTKSTQFDIKQLPDSLVIILNEFVKLMKAHAK